MRHPKCISRRTHEVAFERFLRCERDRVQKQIQSIRLAAHFLKELRDLFVAGNIAGIKWNIFTKFADEL